MIPKSFGTPIATGRTAEIYNWDNGRVLKLFRAWMPASTAAHEARIARAVYETGTRVPAVGDVVDIEGRIGILYERIEGVSMMKRLGRQPWRLLHFARCLADLHAEMHTHRVPGLPSQKERVIKKIERADPLPKRLKVRALTTLASLPNEDILCHGDFHPDNVLMTTEGPIIIDWVDATRGHPMADVARTSLLLSAGSVPAETPRPIRWSISTIRRLFHSIYLRRYFQIRPHNHQELKAWQPVVTAARLSENIDAETAQLIARIKAGFPSREA